MTTATNKIDVLTMFQEFLHKVEKGKKFAPITRDAKITNLGIDSLVMMEIIGCFEDELNIKLPDEKLARLQTVGDIETVILEQMRGPVSHSQLSPL
jgi:acyl carrier protein